MIVVTGKELKELDCKKLYEIIQKNNIPTGASYRFCTKEKGLVISWHKKDANQRLNKS